MDTKCSIRLFFYLILVLFIALIIYIPQITLHIWEGIVIILFLYLLDNYFEHKKQLNAQKNFLLEIFEYIPDLIFLTDVKNRFIASNASFVKAMKQKTGKDIIGKTYLDLMESNVAKELMDINKKIIKTKEGSSYEKAIRLSEEEVIFEVKKFPLVLEGRVKGVIGTAKDITQERILENKLIEKRSQMIALLNNIDSIAYLKDIKGNIISGNKKFEDFIQQDIKKVIGKKFLRESEDVLALDKEVISLKKSQKTEKEIETSMGKNWVEFRKSPVFDKNMNVIGITVLINDISERKAIENYLVEAQKEALQASLVKSQLLANVSHEIKTPVGGIIGFLELLDVSISDVRQKRLIGNALKSSEHLLKLINSLLDLSKIESGAVKVYSYPFNLREVVDDSLYLVQASKNEKNIEMHLDFDELIPLTLYGDAMKVQQVLCNILENSIKFTEEGAVFVTCKLEENADTFSKVYFEIKDTGIGIENYLKDKIFDSFVQADTSLTKKYGGVGLGLTICKELLGLMNSSINFESEYQKGTTVSFSINFPKISSPISSHQTYSGIV